MNSERELKEQYFTLMQKYVMLGSRLYLTDGLYPISDPKRVLDEMDEVQKQIDAIVEQVQFKKNISFS